MSEKTANILKIAPAGKSNSAQSIVGEFVSNELVFGVVGPVGSGTSTIATALEQLLRQKGYETVLIKARDIIVEWAKATGFQVTAGKKMEEVVLLQNAGDEMRKQDSSAIAVKFVESIRNERARQKGEKLEIDTVVEPDGKKRAYIIDSLRNPAEAMLLRRVYAEAFCLIAVVCEEELRKDRLTQKYKDAGQDQIEEFMDRDEKAEHKYGQQVADTFHLADFFVDNTADRLIHGAGKVEKSNPEWTVPEELGRLVDLLAHSKIVRPRANETAMNHAYGARMRSACLSRQVGAAIVDEQGNVVATGTNEVPRAGGGVYGGVFLSGSEADPTPDHDHRCYVHGGYCRNNREQNEIIKELFSSIAELKSIKLDNDLIKRVRKSRIGQLIEFSRSVHAEMDALLSAARQGKSPMACRLFVTTFPCHNCARHIVAAGVDEVQFIEPYLKSKAIPLHGDAITTSKDKWASPSALKRKGKDEPGQVLFRPFTGVAPRLYRRAFYKDRELKDNFNGGLLAEFGPPEGNGANEPLRVSYPQMETTLMKAQQ
ncbi:anti-phage dCTP deaminase [Dongia sp.]|uniref:anti-phage dCTP deaminase n=1 Tax=Dongia sp. TaxID=1977262 RepID=UPI0035B1B3D1